LLDLCLNKFAYDLHAKLQPRGAWL